MATSRSAWQERERQAARLFLAQRQPLSGSGGRPDQTRSDSTHPRLFIETKLRVSHAARTLHDETRVLAKREGKTPVVALASKGRPGLLLCIHDSDMTAVAREWLALHPDEQPEA